MLAFDIRYKLIDVLELPGHAGEEVGVVRTDVLFPCDQVAHVIETQLGELQLIAEVDFRLAVVDAQLS
jgi:hypothetical protein